MGELHLWGLTKRVNIFDAIGHPSHLGQQKGGAAQGTVNMEPNIIPAANLSHRSKTIDGRGARSTQCGNDTAGNKARSDIRLDGFSKGIGIYRKVFQDRNPYEVIPAEACHAGTVLNR